MQAAQGAAPAPGSCATPPLSAAPAPLQALLLALLIASASAIAAADDAKPAGAKPAAAAGAAGGAAQAGKAGGDTAAPKATGAKAEPKAAAQTQPEQQQQAAADDAPTEVITEEEVEKAVADAVAAQLQARWMGGAYGIAQASWDGLASCGAERGSMQAVWAAAASRTLGVGCSGCSGGPGAKHTTFARRHMQLPGHERA